MAKKSRKTKNARRRFAGLAEIVKIEPKPPFDVEKFVIETMLALKKGHTSQKIRDDLAAWHVPVFSCPCGNKGTLLECGRSYEARDWRWICPGAYGNGHLGSLVRVPCGYDLVKGIDYKLPWEEEEGSSRFDPFRELHGAYEAAIRERVTEKLSSDAGPDGAAPGAPRGDHLSEVVDATPPEGPFVVCPGCNGEGERWEHGAPEARLAGPFVCGNCNGTGEVPR